MSTITPKRTTVPPTSSKIGDVMVERESGDVLIYRGDGPGWAVLHRAPNDIFQIAVRLSGEYVIHAPNGREVSGKAASMAEALIEIDTHLALLQLTDNDS